MDGAITLEDTIGPTVESCAIRKNTRVGNGAGIGAMRASALIVRNSLIEENVANAEQADGAFVGGGLSIDGGDAVISEPVLPAIV